MQTIHCIASKLLIMGIMGSAIYSYKTDSLLNYLCMHKVTFTFEILINVNLYVATGS